MVTQGGSSVCVIFSRSTVKLVLCGICIIYVVQFLLTRKNVSWMPSIKYRLSIKLYAYPKNNLNLNIISAISLLAGINKRAPRHDWSVGVGGSSCCALRFHERMVTSASPCGDASPEDSREDNDIAVSTL